MTASDPSPLEIEVAVDGDASPDRATLTLRGEIDLATQGELRQRINDLLVEGRIHLVVDLADVTFIDSTGLGVLIGARRRVHGLHGSLSIVGARDEVMRVFEITGLHRVFDISRAAENV